MLKKYFIQHLSYKYTLALVCGFVMLLPRLVAGETEADQVVVMIVPMDQEEISIPVVRAVESQLSDLNVTLVISTQERLPDSLESQIDIAKTVAGENRAIAVFWCDLRAKDQLFLYLSEYEGKNILVRRLEKTEETGRAEGLAIILRSSVEAMLQGGQIGVNPPVKRKPVQAPASKPEPVYSPGIEPIVSLENEASPQSLFALQVAYALHVYSSDHPAVHGVNIGVNLHVHPNLSLIAGYTFIGNIEENSTNTPILVRIRKYPAYLGLRLSFQVGIIELGGSVSLIVDYTTQEILNISSDAMFASSDTDDVFIGVFPALEILIPIVDRLKFFVFVSAEVPFNAKQYSIEVSEGPDNREGLLNPWPIQPWIFAGIWVDLLLK